MINAMLGLLKRWSGGWVCKYCGTYNESGGTCNSCRQPKG